MDEETNQAEVNNVDATTTSDSSDANQTTTDDTNVTTSDKEVLADGTPIEDKTVPYTAFKEVKDELKAMREEFKSAQPRTETPADANIDPQVKQQRELIKQGFKEMADELGYVSKDQLRREKADTELESELQRLEKTYDGKADPALKFSRQEVVDFAIKNGISNPEMAFKLMREEAFTNFRIKQALSKTGGIKTEGSDGSGSQTVTTTNEDLKAAIAKGDRNAKDILLSRVTRKVLGGKS